MQRESVTIIKFVIFNGYIYTRLKLKYIGYFVGEKLISVTKMAIWIVGNCWRISHAF